MYLATVRVRNFRNLKDLEVGFSKGLNVIVGENNVGKTNLLDAVRAALGPASIVGEPIRLMKEDRHRDAKGVYASDPIKVDLAFDGLSVDEQAECLEILDYDAAAPEKSKASIHFEWSWDEKAHRWHAQRWGGDRPKTEAAVPDEVLQAIPVTILTALRDALVALSPGRASRLGQLLRAVATPDQQKSIASILADANTRLERDPLITSVEGQIGSALKDASGPRLGQEAIVRATEPQFERIVNNLRLVLRGRGASAEVLSELRSNGLGFNNLLYVATVLAELDAAKEATLPLLLVEEPEAHLHPQLQILLADHLTRGGATSPGSRVQTIVTTHSPTVAAHVQPDVLRVLHRDPTERPRCAAIRSCGLSDEESRKLRRMLDVTRASMLFARGVILVEGITEGLLLPVLARRLGDRFDLAHASVAVVPMAGVNFGTFGKLFGENMIDVPVAIVTDGDPTTEYPEGPERKTSAIPKKAVGGAFEVCDRVQKLLGDFTSNARVKVFHASVTLEYDLAAAGPDNGLVLFDAWKDCYTRQPKTLTRELVEAATSTNERALLLWRAICLGDPLHGKAEVAQALAGRLDARGDNGEYKTASFEIPKYLKEAFEHALPRLEPQLI